MSPLSKRGHVAHSKFRPTVGTVKSHKWIEKQTAVIHSINVSGSFSGHWAFAFLVGTNIAVTDTRTNRKEV
jgi:hypothetical protein